MPAWGFTEGTDPGPVPDDVPLPTGETVDTLHLAVRAVARLAAALPRSPSTLPTAAACADVTARAEAYEQWMLR